MNSGKILKQANIRIIFLDLCSGWNPENFKLDKRFRYGHAPQKKADYAFLLHCLYHVKDKEGIMAIVLPHGVLFRGAAEYQIRKNLLENHNIETIIGFPGNMFFATGIPVIVMVLSKGRDESDVLFIDASASYGKERFPHMMDIGTDSPMLSHRYLI
ncbi:N-6 DNA methylase [Lachnospiraceae bacterium 48-21]